MARNLSLRERKPLLSRFNSIGILHRQFIHLVSFLVLVSAQSLGLFVCILNSQEDCKSHCVPRKARKEIKATIPVLDFERYFSIAFSPAAEVNKLSLSTNLVQQFIAQLVDSKNQSIFNLIWLDDGTTI